MNSKQAENLMKLDKIGNIKVKASPHHTLNYSKGVISESEFQRDLEEDLLECLKDQNAIAVKRITIKRNGQIFPTKHLILIFNNPTLPKSVKIAYINCPVKPYIPDSIRCFKSSVILLQPVEEHPRFSRSCPSYKLEKEIQTIKITKKSHFKKPERL
ncbi:hypothetical protein AVEN_158977-1 [Araneus ventricosus]|uniref:Pre-C2HC domain-containing protein n=1 Tax=Araneus ventricosus TaxID=182803 RepID=A0A4Y2B9H8_ARAVE|nr:hypothetical protein AVEN_158977-1 [Araneus ventricosus]